MIGPSNPVISIGPILAVPGLRDALLAAAAPIVAVSPLVRGAVLKGPTDHFLAWAGHPLSSEGIAAHYDGLLDGLVADERADSVPTLVTDVEMGDADARRRVARETLAFAARRSPVRIASCARPRSCRSSPSRAPSSASATPSAAASASSWPPRWCPTCWPRSPRCRRSTDIVVVTAEPLAARAAEQAGASVVDDPEEAGQSAAAARGIEAALVRGRRARAARPGRLPGRRAGGAVAAARAHRRRRRRS